MTSMSPPESKNLVKLGGQHYKGGQDYSGSPQKLAEKQSLRLITNCKERCSWCDAYLLNTRQQRPTNTTRQHNRSCDDWTRTAASDDNEPRAPRLNQIYEPAESAGIANRY